MKIEKKSKEGEDKQTNRQKQTKDRQTPRNRYTGVNKSLVNVALKKLLVYKCNYHVGLHRPKPRPESQEYPTAFVPLAAC